MSDIATIDPLSSDLSENFDRFIVEALELGCVWGLQGKDGWALCSSSEHDDVDVIPFWSQEQFAALHCVDDWADYQVVPLDLEEFLEDWLPGMHDDVLLVGVNWNGELEGEEIEPLDLLEEFESDLTE
jgi:hypothetical protein